MAPLPTERARELLQQPEFRQLSYLSGTKLRSIHETLQQVERDGLPGIAIEAGCGLGGSTIMIAVSKSSYRPLFAYDVFGMIPPPSKEDGAEVSARYATIVSGKSEGIDGQLYYGYEKDLLTKVRSNLKQFGVNEEEQRIRFVRGLLQETLKVNQPVAFAHIDVDWYEPVFTCLRRIVPNLVVGGSVILDDFYDWPGCRKAVREYFNGRENEFSTDTSAGSLKVTRLQQSNPNRV